MLRNEQVRCNKNEVGRGVPNNVDVAGDPTRSWAVEEGGPSATALRNAGYELASFIDPRLALDALDAARTVELLITRVIFPAGKPNGRAWRGCDDPISES
jgi:hypothetical protein